MTKKQLGRYEMLVRVREFGAKHQDRFPEAGVGGRAFATVAGAVEQLGNRAVAQLALRQNGARTRVAARKTLLDLLGSISRTARSIQAADPAFPNTFRLPKALAAQKVLTTARLFARDAAPIAPVFVAHQMPDTFVATLQAAIDAYTAELDRREEGKGAAAAAREGIARTLDEALNSARQLDGIVRNVMAEDSAAVADWTRARQLPNPDRGGAPDAPSGDAPAPVAQTPAVTPPDTTALAGPAPAAPDSKAA